LRDVFSIPRGRRDEPAPLLRLSPVAHQKEYEVELFKYMPYRPLFFTNLLLRFTPLSEFNDPFEGQVKTSSLIPHVGTRMKIFNGNFWEPLPEGEAIKLLNTRKMIVEQELGVLSLSRSKHSLLMWAHYASNHEGIIVGFNSEHHFFNQDVPSKQDPPDRTLHLGKVFPVVYDRIRPDADFGDNYRNSLFQKSDEWMYEKEYRMFMRREDCDEIPVDSAGNKIKDINLFKVPETAITSILIGVRANKEAIKLDLIRALKINPNLSHIKIETAELHSDLYHIEHIPVEITA
jgi:hypothetical protein